jgi:hypothetical protein
MATRIPRKLVWKEQEVVKGVGCSNCKWMYEKPSSAETGPSLRDSFREHDCDQHPVDPLNPADHDDE